MKQELSDFTGKTSKIACLGCARENGEISIGHILRTGFFDAHQDFEIPIEGFVIVSSRRHIQSIDEFTEEEEGDFIKTLVEVRKAMRECLKIDTTYLIQEEDTSHHFHVWVFPRHSWMEEMFGKKIQSVQPIMEYARSELKTDKNIQKVKEANRKLREWFEKNKTSG